MTVPVNPNESCAEEQTQGLVDHFFRHQYGRLIAASVRRFGASNLEHIEDGVQAALEQALGSWSRRGIPANPEAWLYQAAQHRVIDQLRRGKRLTGIENLPVAEDFEFASPSPVTFVDEIDDDELRMLFVCADSALSERTRLVLCLKLLCGFSTHEIATRLFLSDANVQKMLERGRTRLREQWAQQEQESPGSWAEPERDLLAERLAAVQRVIYLQFNEGYSSLREGEPLRPELCFEALRLGDLLVSEAVGDTGSSWALLALMHFHAARLSTRIDGLGQLLLLEAQDRSAWDKKHIYAGMHCLTRSGQGDDFSCFHGEAAIQAEHCLAPSYEQTRWNEIVELYELLERLKPSPLYTLNRAIALSEWRGPEVALEILTTSAPPSWLSGYYLWDATIGEMLRRCGYFDRAQVHLTRALEAAPTNAEKSIFARRLDQVTERSTERRLPPNPRVPRTRVER